MFIKKEIENFEDLTELCWSGAVDRLERAEKTGREEELFEIVEEYMSLSEEIPTAQKEGKE